MRAKAEGIRNLFVFCNHVTIIPPMKAILDSPDLQLDGFLGPGHVSTVVGIRPFEFVTNTYNKPVVVVGFEPLDILQGVHMIIQQIHEGRCEVENQYKRVVHDDGNPKALEVLARVFKLRSHFEWRGLGFISQSALELQDEFADYDAEKVFSVPGVRVADPKACQCGEVLKGVLKPWECKVFGTACTPETPIGTCMVSSEGACAAYYNFGRYSRARERERVLASGEHPNGNGHATAMSRSPNASCDRSRCRRDDRHSRPTRQRRGDQGGVGAHRRPRAARARAHRRDSQAQADASRGRDHDESRRRREGQPHADHRALRRHPQQPGARPAR